MTASQRLAKRAFDLVLASLGLLLTGWLIVLTWLLASLETRTNGFYLQERVGLNGSLFRIIKNRTMQAEDVETTSVTTENDSRITFLGRFFRAAKIDELPQLLNVLLGDMSFVGPRPDVPGFADELSGDDRIILSIRPGITGPATLAFRHEEQLLAQQANPEEFNRTTIYPQKVALNKAYLESWSLLGDLGFIYKTLLPG
jgi:lipopolysaccharide/colanic/teichoic acid biosynthesis glycosyltransferase